MHPHIVQIYDAVVDDDQSYIVMEYVPGGTLEPFCTPDNLLPIDRVVEMIFKCTRALDYAYRLGITHRDIKPANILLRRADSAAATSRSPTSAPPSDQRAQPTSTQVSGVGSPAYMSPQQVREHAAQPPDRHLLARRGDVPVAHRPPAVPGAATTTA